MLKVINRGGKTVDNFVFPNPQVSNLQYSGGVPIGGSDLVARSALRIFSFQTGKVVVHIVCDKKILAHCSRQWLGRKQVIHRDQEV